jgi:hypothetical protein
MSASYSVNLTTDKDWVRMLIGDRDVTSPIFQDEEINAVLAEEANKYLAAAAMGGMILARGRGLVEKAVDDLRLRWSDNPKSAYSAYIQNLREKGAEKTFSRSSVFRVLS